MAAASSHTAAPHTGVPGGSLGRRARDWIRRLQGRVGDHLQRRRQRLAALTPEQQRRRRRRRRIAAVLIVVLLLAYPVIGTLLLWTGLLERMVASEDLRVEIDNPAYTIWPGRFHMQRAKILVNGETQFTLEGSDLVFRIAITPLFERTIHVTQLDARGVRYRMRVQVDDTKGIEERLAAYPKLEGLPGANVVREKTAEQTEEREASWTVHVQGLDIRVSELWFMEYRYLGDGTLRGGFLVGPNRMRVDTSVQDLGPGQLRFGAERVISKNLGGRVVATIPEVDPEKYPDARFLDFVTARIQLQGDLENISHFGAYAQGIEFREGRGPFKADLSLDRGWVGKGSQISYRTDDMRVAGDGFGVKTDWDFQIRVLPDGRAESAGRSGNGGDKAAAKTPPPAQQPEKTAQSGPPAKADHDELPRISSRAKSTYVSLAGGGKNFTIAIHGHKQDATLKSAQIGSKLALEHAELRFPTIVSTDLDDLGAVVAEESGGVKSKSGAARASLSLDVDENWVARGPFQARLDKAKLDIAGVDLGADGSARADVRVDIKNKTAELRDVNLSLADVSMHVGDEAVDNWWINMSSTRMFAAQGPPLRYETTINVRAKDAEPILEALAEKDKLNDLIAKFTSLDDLRLTLTMRGAGDTNDVLIRSLESDVWDVAGRVYSTEKRTLAALVIGGQAVSIGVATDGKNTEIMPFARTEWLNEKLRAFPKPVEQLPPAKP